jgi:opacity protein-like surface antigen
MKKVAIAALFALASAAAHADSITDYVHAEIGIGGSAYANGPDGLWYQDGFEHKLDLTAPAVRAGLTGPLYERGNWGIDWHIDYVWLGTVHTNAEVPSAKTNTSQGKWVGADFIGANTSNPCNGPCTNLSDFIGSGHDMGVSMTLEPHYTYRGWTLGVEAGPYFHRSTWSEDVTDWYASATSAPANIHVAWRPVWSVGAVVGASVSYRNFGLSYQYYLNKQTGSASNPYNPIWTGAHVLMATYRF